MLISENTGQHVVAIHSRGCRAPQQTRALLQRTRIFAAFDVLRLGPCVHQPSSDETSSDEEEDDDGEDTEMELEEPKSQDGIVNLRANRGKKPIMKLGDEDLGPDIRGFLKDFLPQLKAANEELEAQKKAGTLKSLDSVEAHEEGEPYIEMVSTCFCRVAGRF